MTSGVPKFARNSAVIHKAVINSVHVIVAPDLMSQVAIRNCCYVAQWFRTKIFHCPISSGSKDGASKRKSDVVHFVVVFSGLVIFPTKTLCFGYKRIHYLMILMRSIKKTQSKFLLRYELGMEESKADKDRSRSSLERRIFWAQSQLSSSIRSEVMKDKLRHVKSRMKHMKKTDDSSIARSSSTEKESACFLDASSHLYKRVCPSVRPSVGHTRVEIAIQRKHYDINRLFHVLHSRFDMSQVIFHNFWRDRARKLGLTSKDASFRTTSGSICTCFRFSHPKLVSLEKPWVRLFYWAY